MFDSNLMFTAAAVTADGNSTVLDLGSTPAGGVVVEVAIPAVSGSSPTMDIVVQESADSSSWQIVSTFAQLTATGRHTRIVQTAKRYLRMNYDIGGSSSPSFTMANGIASGFPGPDQTVVS